MTSKNAKELSLCQDSDNDCPICHGECKQHADLDLFRIDMQDETGTPFCYDCASDAMDSGVFTTKDEQSEGL